ncbi:MAG: redox-sensing transcriptional repressor Rex [Eubacteriales bacterium]
MQHKEISKAMLKRLPVYLSYLKSMPDHGQSHISATALATALGMGEVQVRKDLATVCHGGRPKIGYPIDVLQSDLESFLGYNNTNNAVLIGAGKLGKALLGYTGFAEYGLNIVAGFDSDEALWGKTKSGKNVLPMSQLPDVCKNQKIYIAVLTVPAEYAQDVCNQLIEIGIQAIWNFAPTHLEVPSHILVHNENMAASLALLSKHLTEHLGKTEE